MSKQRGRHPEPIRGNGPVYEFAEHLRMARAGTSLRSIASEHAVSIGAISQAMNGLHLPTMRQVQTILEASGRADQVERFRALHEHTERELARRRPDLGACLTDSDLLDRIDALRGEFNVDLETIIRIVTSTDVPKTQVDLGPPPKAEEILTVLAARARPLSRSVLVWTVFACGGRKAEVEHWARRFDLVEHQPVPTPRAASATSAPQPESAAHPARAIADPVPVSVIEGVDDREPPAEPADPQTGAPSDTEHQDGGQNETPPCSAIGANVSVHTALVSGPAHSGRIRVPKLAVGAAVLAAVASAGTVLMLVAPGWYDHTRPDSRANAQRSAPGPLDTTPSSLTKDRSIDPHVEAVASELAQRTLASTDPVTSGRYDYIHLLMQAHDSAEATVAAQMTTTDQETWCDGDEGTQITVTTEPGESPKRQRTNPCGDDPSPLPAAPSTDPAVLSQQLQHVFPETLGPRRWLLAIAQLNAQRILNLQQRAAVLQLLARLPGITSGELSADKHNRAGIAFTASDGSATGIQETLIFSNEPLPVNGADGATGIGVLLSHETLQLNPEPRKRYVASRTLYLEHSRRDSTR